MKKVLLVTILLLSGVSNYMSAQRYLPGQKGIQVTGGLVDVQEDSYYAGIGYSVYTKSRNHWEFNAEFLNRNTDYITKKIPVSQFTGEAGYFVNLLSDRKDILFISLGVSAMAGYETINWNKRKLNDGARIQDKDNFLLGGAVTLEVEAYLTDRIALLLHVKERGLWGGDTEKFHNQIGIGIKYIYN